MSVTLTFPFINAEVAGAFLEGAAEWLNEPRQWEATHDSLRLTTDPGTDLWQRSYYGFRNDNAPALLVSSRANFTFTARASFRYAGRFDQCGVLIYLDSDSWFKASVEFEDEGLSRLGSVVTNGGHSDWATTDVASVQRIWYRLSRRGPDFLIESSPDGQEFSQMRVFHLASLGQTTEAMGVADPPFPPGQAIRLGVYACSPTDSSFTAVFDQMTLEPTRWKSHRP